MAEKLKFSNSEWVKIEIIYVMFVDVSLQLESIEKSLVLN